MEKASFDQRLAASQVGSILIAGYGSCFIMGLPMHKTYNEQADLGLVSAYLADRGLHAERFPHPQTQAGKTPDFRVRQDGTLRAYCEVKSPTDPWLDDPLDGAPPLTLVGGARPDPIFNRLSRLLMKADARLAAVNPTSEELNILAYVNHDDASSYKDLREILTGYFRAADGTKHPTMMDIAEGCIGEAKRRIDAFLWFEGWSGRMAGAVINIVDPERVRRTCSLLEFDSGRIR